MTDRGPKCTHHWVFGTPQGQINVGTCKYCGDQLECVNYLDPAPLSIWKGPLQFARKQIDYSLDENKAN
jgi:hypothetical protein